MPKIERILAEVERLVDTVKPREAEERLRALIGTMGDDELRTWEADVRLTIGRFLPKRRKSLLLVLDQRLAWPDGAPSPPRPAQPEPELDYDRLASAFAGDLRDLSEHHMFQWSTFYRDVLSFYFDRFLGAATNAPDQEVLHLIREPLTAHSQEVFVKHFRHQRPQGRQAHDRALTKSLNGLQRFLDLPIEFFSAKDTAVSPAEARTLRAACSGMLRAVLEGYAQAWLGRSSGSQVLPAYPRPWAHSLAFLTDADLGPLLRIMEPGEFSDGVARAVRPVIQALDDLPTKIGDYVPLTALAQLDWQARRLDASIQPPPYASEPQLIEIQCYLDGSSVSRPALEEAANRNVGVVVAPLRPDLRALVNGSDRLKQVVVAAAEDQGHLGGVRQRVVTDLEFAIYKRRSPRMGAQPLQYNFAREFPLHNPFLTRYFHVYRSSIRELLRTFERRNGVRLWCSIRRSGKTTACLDLGTTTGRSVIVSQTCETTGQLPEGSLFYDSVCEALAHGRQLPPTYFAEIVQRVAARSSREDRVVFVLDEYETFFGRLKSAVAREPDLRYTVAQPLLNQMVAFTRENLLVLLGQQPNAHFILMDQNQLSAYVQQDSFPLFQHEPGTAQGELAELIHKVLTERVSIDPSFIDGVYDETAGHPFLTVNLLVEFVDWLIEKGRTVSSLQLDADDVAKFSKEKLRPKKVSLSAEYRFFREAISEALGSEARVTTPWLHAIYSCVRGVARASPGDTFICSRRDFDNMVERTHLPEIGMDADLLLATGAQANFLAYDEGEVWPRIRLLARLAAVTRGKVVA